MSNGMRLIEGEVEDFEATSIREMAGQIRDLEAQLKDAHRELALTKRESVNALGALRKQLSPLYQALQAIFGQLDAAGVEETSGGNLPHDSRVSAVWASWKEKLGRGEGLAIDALLVHGELNSQQLAIAIKYHRTSIPKIIYNLNKAGLINKNGGRFSLKKI